MKRAMQLQTGLALRSEDVPLFIGRQSPTALAITRGTIRFLSSIGFCCIAEVDLRSRRKGPGPRADLVAVREKDGEIWIVEIKSSVDDLRRDQKWRHYRQHCDQLFFAVTKEFSRSRLPSDTGLIVADANYAGIEYQIRQRRLGASARKAKILRLACVAAQRWQWRADPFLKSEATEA
jgi:hypothetical protein